MAALGIFIQLSFSSFNVCEVASENVVFVKEQTQLALDNPDFQISRYHAFKAINGIWKAKYSFSECGCHGLSTNMELASKNLKEATRAESMEDQKVFLNIAMQNTLTSINAIKGHQIGNNNLANNPTKAPKTMDVSRKLVEDAYLEQIEDALSKFENSLSKVVELEDCENSYSFIRAMQDETHEKLGKKDLTNRKIYYLTRVVEITNGALLKVNGKCNIGGSLAGK